MAYTVFGGKIAYNDVELLGTDGTTGRTTLIKNINAGGSANVGNSALTGAVLPFAVVGNYAYFSATDGSTGQELWRTDGTTVGTTKVTEFSTSSGTADPFDDVTGYNPSNIVAANGYIFFSGSGPAVSSPGTTAARYGIWRYDPGSNTTAFVSDSSLGINNMISNGSRVYWTYDGGFGSGLWTSDGVSAAQSIYSTASLNSPPSALFNAGGTVYLGIGGLGGGVKKVVGTAVSDVTGAPIGPLGFVQTSSHVYMISQSNTLFVTTTASSTATQITAAGLTFDFSSTPGGHTAGFAALGNKLIFSNNKPVNSGVGANTGSEVWITDGTGAGTVVLKDIVAGIGSSNPHNFITVGSAVFFQATNGNGSVELWKTDGTGAGTVLVDTLFAGGMSPGGGSIITTLGMENMSVSNGVLYFSFDDQVHGNELWRSDGTAAGTLMLKDVNPSVIDQGFQNFYVNPYGANLGTTGVFVGWSQATGYEIYSSNGTPGGTALLKDIAPGGGSSNASQFVVSGGTKAFFTAYSPAGGIELWVTDGTSAGTVQVKDINPGVASSNASGMVAIGSYVYFTADNGVNGQELWASDGTAAGTYMIADIDATSSGGFPRSGSPGGFVFSGGQVFFLANQSTTGRELWVTNGTSGGTHITKNIGPTSSDGNIQGTPIAYNNKVYFAAQDTATNGIELWVSDGSDAGTIMLKNIDSTAFSSGYPTDFVLANNLFFFRAQNAGVSDVYKSDGTEPGTVPVTTGLGLSSIGSLVGAGNKVFFSGQGTSGSELYVTSGATATLLDIFSGPTGSNPNYLTALGSKVVFSAASSAALGNELWVSDGTAGVGHTFMLKDINTNASASSDPQSFMVVGSRAYFTANDGVNGRELWFTDGTFTIFVTNIGPGGTDGQIQPLRALDNNHLLFLANDGSSGGQELWITDGSAGGTFKASNVVQPDGTFSTGGGFVSLNGGGFPGGNFATVPGLTLGGGDDTFVGGADSDYFDGLGGNDTLIGGTGDDILVGGIGNDVFFVDSLGDFIIEASSGGNDRVAASATYVLNATAEVETMETTSLSGTAAINLYGNGFVQTIVGNNGNNLLDGGGGNDTLIGAGGNDALVGQAGADTMYGGVGDDVFYVDSDFDFVSENAGEGNDRVASAGSYTLASGVSVETLEAINYADTSALNLTGNALNQTITGNNGANVLIGGGGNDTLNGAGGDDTIIGNTSASTMIGGSGNDVFFVYDTSDAVIEASGGGSDRIASAASYTLLATSEVETIETASLASTTAINLTGNQFVNTITGNNGANVLDGKGGNDTLNGAGAADIYAFTTALGAGNVDLVLGFVSSSDKIGLDDAIFTAIVPGALAAGAFVVSSAATDGDDRIIYNQGTGALYYDPDGTGGAAQVQFATLAGGGTLLGSDFLLI